MKLKRIIAVAVVMALSACAGGEGVVKDTFATPTISNQQYMAMSAQERQNYLGAVAAEDRAITQKNDVEYLAGRPIHYGDSRTGYTVVWAKRVNQILFFPGHTSGAWGQESQIALALAADNHGQPRLVNGVPIVLSASASHQEGLGRFFARGAFSVLSATMNGAVGAKITADAKCGNNCGNTIVQAISGSESVAVSETDVDISSNSCPTCGILND